MKTTPNFKGKKHTLVFNLFHNMWIRYKDTYCERCDAYHECMKWLLVRRYCPTHVDYEGVEQTGTDKELEQLN